MAKPADIHIQHVGAHGDDHHAGHPGPRLYIIIGVVLTILTIAEVAVYYIEALSGVLVPLLLVLSAAKFILVVQYYMHLKFDSKVFTSVFLGPFALAVLVIVSLVLLFHVLPDFKYIVG
jgi:cytochrome c oxidase subunit IV